MLASIADFFEFNADRFLNPFVISGLVLLVLSVAVLIFRAPISYQIARRLKNASDAKMERVQLIVMIVCLIVAVIGAVLAVAFVV